MRIPYVVSIISTGRCDDYKDGVGRTCVLLMQNMEPNISNNGSERIANCIMCGNVLSPMITMT
jgi:hypothetical protein